jgi:uncharacterized protein
MEQIIKISAFILKSFIHILPYLLVTIPLAVVINLSGASKHITKVFGKNPLLSVFLATVVGAFSPFCSCGVIPVVYTLLTGGVPLAPVMSFWIASPSMDPEIFFLSSSMLGWKLAVWRLASTFFISLLAGYITHFATIKRFISTEVLNGHGLYGKQVTIKSIINSIRSTFVKKQVSIELVTASHASFAETCCAVFTDSLSEESYGETKVHVANCSCRDSVIIENGSLRTKIFREIMKATIMVTKFMGIAFLLTALITFYLPNSFIAPLVSGSPVKQVVLATLIGIPMYTSNLTALPLVGGMINLGLNNGAALSFLIAGATTTLPAMVAVWGIAKRRVFFLYLSFALFGALLAGLCFNLFN